MRRIFILSGLLFLLGCTGNIGDLFDAFPASAFEPDQPDGGLPPIPGAFDAIEIGFAESAQGVTGDVRNIEVLSFGAQVLAFCTAGPDGVHIVDVTRPDRIPAATHITTVSDANLTAPAEIAGGRVDAIAIIDGTYLVCVAVGTSATNAVTVFHIPTLMDRAITPTSDLSDAYIGKVPLTEDIAVPGNAMGKAGGVAGFAGNFMVATGGPELGIGAIITGTPLMWAGLPAATVDTPKIDEFLDVKIGGTAIYTSVKDETGKYGILAASFTITPPDPPNPALPPTITVIAAAPDITEIVGTRFDTLETDSITGPGNFFLDLSLDIGSLYVTGDDRVHSFTITAPTNPGIGPIADFTGLRTISVAAQNGTFAIGNRDQVRIYTSFTGQPVLQSQYEFPNTLRQIRGVALIAATDGRYVLCCAGERGLRIVQWSNTQ